MNEAAAVVLTYGRVELDELLACLERQTVQVPTLIYVDDVPELVIEAPELALGVVWRGATFPRSHSIGLVRRAAIEAARGCFGLTEASGVIVLDDDDFYSSRHFELTLKALGEAPGGWTGGLAMGLTNNASWPPEYVRSVSGVGQHATWAFRLGLYDQAGGYPDVGEEDTALGYGMTWKKCLAHYHCTHVRRHHDTNLSGVCRYDRARMRAIGRLTLHARPRWTERCEALEQWCQAQR